jgi:hypothetical protein
MNAQGRRNDVKARGADFRERALLNWYILRDVCKASGVELCQCLIMFSIYWMIGMWGGSPPGDCAILEARRLHFLCFLKQICKRISAVQTPVFHLRLRPNYSSELRLRPHHKILNKCFTIREHLLILLWITLFALPNYQIT